MGSVGSVNDGKPKRLEELEVEDDGPKNENVRPLSVREKRSKNVLMTSEKRTITEKIKVTVANPRLSRHYVIQMTIRRYNSCRCTSVSIGPSAAGHLVDASNKKKICQAGSTVKKI